MNLIRCGFLVPCLLGVVASAVSEAPGWLLQAAKIPTPATAAKAPVVVLLNDTKIEISATGLCTQTHRQVIRILRESATNQAVGVVHYYGTSDKIESLGAWLVRDNKTIENRGRGDWNDVAYYAAGAVVDESRLSTLSLADKAAKGDVFGYETRHQGPLAVAQYVGYMLLELPTVRETLTFSLPPGFNLESRIFGEATLTPSQPAPNTWAWTFVNPDYLPEESYEDPAARYGAEISVRIIPPASATRFPYKDFASWTDVVDYYLTLNAGQCDSNPALAAKAGELTAGLTAPLAKIKVLAQHVQKLRYVAINQKIKLGHGYRPRKATEVFTTGFGDCKDKANLLVAMLREAGITAYSVGAYAGKNRLAKQESPTPMQFNHAITAIEVGPEVDLPSVVQDPALGRLLFFDPTDSYTRFGDLPYPLQGSLVHVECNGSNQLTALPAFSAETDFRLDRRLELALLPDGGAQITGTVSAGGQSGAGLRRAFETANMPKELEDLVGKQLNDKYRAAVVVEKKTEDDPVSGRCTLRFVCAQPKLEQWLQGSTGIVKLDLLSRRYMPNIPETERHLPVKLPPMAVNDEIVLLVPDGFVVAEVPAKTELSSVYGSCQISCESAEGKLVFKRRIVIQESRIPVADYPALRKFLSDLAKADRATVLIKPKA